MADARVPVHVLQKIAGHGSLTTTQLYLHPADERSIRDAGQALSAHLDVSATKPAVNVRSKDLEATSPIRRSGL
jgi:hypothetical protein